MCQSSSDKQESYQQRTEEWFKARVGKINASDLGDLVGFNGENARDAKFEQLKRELQTNESQPRKKPSPEMRWGIDNEAEAIKAYTERMKKETGEQVQVEKSPGMQHPTHAFLRASPDGLVGEDGMLEVKCPSRNIWHSPASEGNVRHEYKLQINMQLSVYGREWCDLWIWKKAGSYRKRFHRDDVLFEHLVDNAYRPFYGAAVNRELKPPPMNTEEIFTKLFESEKLRVPKTGVQVLPAKEATVLKTSAKEATVQEKRREKRKREKQLKK